LLPQPSHIAAKLGDDPEQNFVSPNVGLTLGEE
jgi:hypothetical protein